MQAEDTQSTFLNLCIRKIPRVITTGPVYSETTRRGENVMLSLPTKMVILRTNKPIDIKKITQKHRRWKHGSCSVQCKLD